MKVATLNNGCVKEMAMMTNLFQKMEQYGIERAMSLEESDYLIYITCAGTGDMIKKELNDISLLSENPMNKDYKVILVGCLINHFEKDFEVLKDNPNIKIITNKEWVIPVLNYINDMNKKNTYKEVLNNRTRILKTNASIQFLLQSGCSNRCTFCKTNYLDSKLSSIPFELAIDHLANMIKNGTRKISLNGQNTTLYGLDLYNKQRLHEFIHELSKIDGLEMINIDELVVGDMYPELLEEIINNPKVVSASLQLETASNRLLKLMGRNYSLEEYDAYAKKILESDKYINTILMSGFPTETMEDTDYTLNYIKERKIIAENICEYKDFEFIPSHNYEQYTKKEKERHSRYLIDENNKIKYDIFLSEMNNQNKLIYLDTSNNNHVFISSMPSAFTISNSKKFNNLTPGDIINECPKILVKKNNYTKGITYKI